MPHRVRAEETRLRILAAARTCFSRSGYEGASVSDICSEAGITKGAFYYHFPSKLELFLELQRVWLSKFDAFVSDSTYSDRPASQRLVDLQELTRGIFTGPETYLPMVLEFSVEAIRNPKIQQNVIEHYRHFVDAFSKLIEDGRRDGSIATDNPLRTSRMLIGMVIGLIVQGLMDPTAEDWGSEVRQSVREFLAFLQPLK